MFGDSDDGRIEGVSFLNSCFENFFFNFDSFKTRFGPILLILDYCGSVFGTFCILADFGLKF